jgi:hypothetical protein
MVDLCEEEKSARLWVVSGGALGMGLMGGEDHQELPVNWFADFSLPSTSPEGRPDADGEPVLRWHQGVGAAQRVRVSGAPLEGGVFQVEHKIKWVSGRTCWTSRRVCQYAAGRK